MSAVVGVSRNPWRRPRNGGKPRLSSGCQRPGPTSPGRGCGRVQRRLQNGMPDKAQLRWSARPVDRSGAPAAAAAPAEIRKIRWRSSESSAGARSAAGGASGRESQHWMCAVAMPFERAHLFLDPSAGGRAVAHQPSQPIDFDRQPRLIPKIQKKKKGSKYYTNPYLPHSLRNG